MHNVAATLARLAALALAPGLIAGCINDTQNALPVTNASQSTLTDGFGDYWYQGEAELTSYDLEQARYGAIRRGSAVTIFVTEDVSRRKQVKLDNPGEAGDDAVNVLKLNSTRNFNTGIYPYSTMLSVFTPVYVNRDPHTLKVTSSVQEWCGQTFAQLNRTSGGYKLQHFSYFESEGDRQQQLPDVVLEDEIWNLIRLRPESLPTGEIDALPATLHQRFSHAEWVPQKAVGSVGRVAGSDSLLAYTLSYRDIDRTLKIHYRKDFPHEIEYWEERHVSGFGDNAQALTTRGVLKNRIKIDYWTRNQPGDEKLRNELGLPAV